MVIGEEEGGLYKLKGHPETTLVHETTSSSELWHRRLAYYWLTKLTLFYTSLHPPYISLISSFDPFIPQILLHFHIFTQIFSKLLRYHNSLISFDLMFKCHLLKDLWLITFLQHALISTAHVSIQQQLVILKLLYTWPAFPYNSELIHLQSRIFNSLMTHVRLMQYSSLGTMCHRDEYLFFDSNPKHILLVIN